MSEMQTMETSATTPEAGAESQAPQSLQATADKLYGEQQQQSGEEQQRSGDNTDGNDGQETGEQEQSEQQGAPEQYEDFKVADGQQQYDPEVIANYKEIAKELNLSQEAAQKFLDKMGPVVAQRQTQQLEHLRGEWADQSSADKEFGGEKLNENLGVARKALDTFGSTELKSLLNESGLGNHPEFIRLLYRAGKAISEDSFVGGKGTPGKTKPTSNADYAASLYPSQQ